MSNSQSLLQNAGRWKSWEYPLWLLALASPLLLGSHALIINEIAIVALFALSLDLILGYTGIVSLGHAAFFAWGAYSAALFCQACDAGSTAWHVGGDFNRHRSGCPVQRHHFARHRPDAPDGDAGRWPDPDGVGQQA
jgi:hypothetical protein